MHLHLQEDWGGLEGKTCQEPPCKEVVVVVVLLLSHLLPPSQGPQPLLWYTIVLYCTLVYNTVGEPDYLPPTTTHPPRKLGFDGRLFLAFRRCSSHSQFTCPVHPCFKAVLWLLCNSAMVHLFLRCFSILEWTIAQFLFQGIRGHQLHFLPQEECLSPGHQNWPDSRGKRNKWLLFAFQPGPDWFQDSCATESPLLSQATHLTWLVTLGACSLMDSIPYLHFIIPFLFHSHIYNTYSLSCPIFR